MNKVRYVYIENLVLNIYRNLPEISFPLNLEHVLLQFPNCRIMSYQALSKISGYPVDEIIGLCESEFACTNYDAEKDRYLILYNSSLARNNTIGRQRWSCTHEIGHVACHHLDNNAVKLAVNNLSGNSNKLLEEEADYFAATLLAPPPLYDILGVKSPVDIRRIFGLSAEASNIRFEKYQNWHYNGNQTAWTNDFRRIYKKKTKIAI